MLKIAAAASFAVLFLAFQTSEAALGFDAINAISSTTFNCLKKANHSFYVGRISRSNGKVDTVGIQNIVAARKAGFSDVDGYIFPCTSSSCPSPGNQVITAVDALRKAGGKIGRLWIDVEILAWPASHSANQNFIGDMMLTAGSVGVDVGIYTNYNNWQSIVGADFDSYGDFPLWWAKYNGAADLTTGWTAFGGWKTPTIHQYSGDTTQCGLGLDKNFK